MNNRPRTAPLFARAYILLALLGLGTASCGSTYLVNVQSNPAGATIFLNGEEIGRTPSDIEVSFATTRRNYVLLLAPNYDPGFQWLTPQTAARGQVQMPLNKSR